MRHNDDFDDRNSDELDEYVAQEMLKHYGEGFVHDTRCTQPSPAPYKKIRGRGFLSVMSIICAVVFLTGVGVLSGVIFSSGVPVNSTVSEPASQSQFISDTASTDTNVYGGTQSKEESKLPEQHSQTNTDSQSSSKTESKPTGQQQNSSDTDSQASSKAESKPTEQQHNHGDTDSQTSGTAGSKPTGNSVQGNPDEDNIVRSRPDYYSLPDLPHESCDTPDIMHSAQLNPNNTVTTGRRVCAGVGIVLIVMSLAAAVWLNKLRENEVQ